ncbi:MAG TPA: isoleucine--tRNA ligase [Candidatus Saccharibacteria bacterium]|nr:isoleucine--tRNA ligase [Candidatus Saccharibacteria bacterium]HMR38111.1 isoleucine--tRNA ligase [Candidatus Saccharibacteria bacterium]
MKFKHGTRRRALEYEKDWVQRWKQDGTFEKSVEQRPKDDAYVFYDGPPFITGNPHHGTLLSSIVKDAVPRYWTMKGKRVERVWGWDCHGLPAENFVEKQLNITDRRQIVTSPEGKAPLDKDGNELPTVTLEHYITKARESMVANSATWEDTIDRIGRWVDFKGAYKTMDKNFMESVWWAFKELYDKGKIYEGEKVLMYDTRFATPVSKNEVTMDNDAYQIVTDPSVFVKFKLEDGSTLLAWTTTPWTLPGNLMLAVSPELTYCEVEVGGEKLVIAEEALERVLKDEKNQSLEYKVVRKFPGSELVSKSYQPLDTGSTWPESGAIHKVYAADFVSHESGSGIVHIAPAYGEDDFELAKSHGVGAFHVIDDNGYYTDTNYKGLEVWDNNKFIAKDLKEKGIVWKVEYIRHEYPFNPRSKQRIMYRAIPSWFFDIQGSKPLMLEQNENINWFPEHLKYGRFAKNIEQAPDWNLSRDRFWATAMPVWKGDKGTVKVIGSYAELKELSGVELEDYHRPWVDDITFEINGEIFTRIDKVLDCWFESGSMPFAQLHYPFENKEKFEANYPADFIVEYVGQVRAWFYYVHAVNTALFGDHAFNNVITTGVVAGNDGRKVSKSLGNFTDPNELMDKFSADSLRFLLLSSPLLNGEDFSVQDKDVGDVARKLSMVWNMYDFFTMYAEVDGWEYGGELKDPLESLTNPLDIWIVSRLHELVVEVEKNMDAYNIPDALSPILPFLDDASNWFVRRSRRRFWKSEDDGDKNDAYKTLHYVLVRLSYILAPFTPFLAEELYHNLTGDDESIHLKNWWSAGRVDDIVTGQMESVRIVVNIGLAQRAKAGIKVRQPLTLITLYGEEFDFLGESDRVFDYIGLIKEELNVHQVKLVLQPMKSGDEKVKFDLQITPELKREGLSREVIRFVQSTRKNAGLNVDDRIHLSLLAEDEELSGAIAEHHDEIYAETLAVSDTVEAAEAEIVKIDGIELKIALEKA